MYSVYVNYITESVGAPKLSKLDTKCPNNEVNNHFGASRH